MKAGNTHQQVWPSLACTVAPNTASQAGRNQQSWKNQRHVDLIQIADWWHECHTDASLSLKNASNVVAPQEQTFQKTAALWTLTLDLALTKMSFIYQKRKVRMSYQERRVTCYNRKLLTSVVDLVFLLLGEDASSHPFSASHWTQTLWTQTCQEISLRNY